MCKLFSVGVFSTHIKHTVMSDCLCSTVITIGIMGHRSENNQKTLNVMSSLLKPFSCPVQGYMKIEGIFFFFFWVWVWDLWERSLIRPCNARVKLIKRKSTALCKSHENSGNVVGCTISPPPTGTGANSCRPAGPIAYQCEVDCWRNARGSGASTHPGKQERVVKGQNTLALKTSSQKTRWLSWVTSRQLCPWGLKSQDLVLTTATDHLI